MKAGTLLTDRLARLADADALYVQAKTAISTNDLAAFTSVCLSRATLLQGMLRDKPGAIAEYEKVLSYNELCPAQNYATAADRLVLLLTSEGRGEEAAKVLIKEIKILSSFPQGIAKKIIDTGAGAAFYEETLAMSRGRITEAQSASDLQARVERIQPDIVELLLALGRPAEAVAECRVFGLCASDKAYPQAAELTARCLKTLDRNIGRANAFLEFQRISASPTEKTENVLLTLPALSDAVRTEATKNLWRRLPPIGNHGFSAARRCAGSTAPWRPSTPPAPPSPCAR